MSGFITVDGLSPTAAEVLQQLGDSGSSEAFAVADCLNTIAENGGDQSTDAHLATCAIEIAEAALSAFSRLAERDTKIYSSTAKTLQDVVNSYSEKTRWAGVSWTPADVQTLYAVSDAEAAAFLCNNQSHIRDRLIEFGWTVLEHLAIIDDLPPVAAKDEDDSEIVQTSQEVRLAE